MDQAKQFRVILQYGGSLKRWEQECGKPVIHLLPRLYVRFALDVARAREDECSRNPQAVEALRKAGKPNPEATYVYYQNEKVERMKLDQMQSIALTSNVQMASPEHDGA